MTTAALQEPSRLLDYLPAIYRDDPDAGQLLLAFEKVLIGRDDGVALPAVDAVQLFAGEGLEQTIDGIDRLFDPQATPKQFLPWLASWLAFSLRADLDEQKQRAFIARIVQHYLWRGTKTNLQELLEIFTIGVPTVVEPIAAELQVGVRATVGVDTFVEGGPPHYFRVTISLPRLAPEVQARQMQIARALIELEKPAYTFYDLNVVYPSMLIGVYSTIGVDTLLGSAS